MIAHSQPPRIVAALGVAAWKRTAIRALLGEPRLKFARSAREAVDVARQTGGAIAMWATREPATLAQLAGDAGVRVARIEDGFIRSAGLGSECLPPASIIIDWSGIYFDPSRPSDLESCLERGFGDPVLARARRLRKQITALGVTKYNLGGAATASARSARRTVLVAGQVSDDLSFRLGGAEIGSNLELLRRVREREPQAEIIYRPHPDVSAGQRQGAHPDAEVLRHADRIERGGDLHQLIAGVDTVHVLTSLTGFEALLRGKQVVTHGQPFYAGWGLTLDLAPPLARRRRRLNLDELVAGALIAYPRYIDPLSGAPCSAEDLVASLADGQGRQRTVLPMLRRLQAGARRAVGLAPPAMKLSPHG